MFTEHTLPAADGLLLYYRAYGGGGGALRPVLCLPGITRNSNDFHLLAEHLAGQGRRVICPDLRGRGKSAYDPNWRNYRPLRLLKDCVWIAQRLEMKPLSVIGTSLGGLLAMGMAALHPGLVSAFVMNDIGPDVNSGGVHRIAHYIRHKQSVATLDEGMEHVRVIFHNTGLQTEDEWRRLAAGSYRLGEDGRYHSDWDPAIANTLSEGGRTRLPLWLIFRALHKTPTLVVRGAHSDILTQETFDRMASVKPDLRRLTVEAAGHTPTLNEPESRAAIDALLAEVG